MQEIITDLAGMDSVHLRVGFCVAKNLTLLKERSGFCPWLQGDNLRMSCLEGMFLSAWGSWITMYSLTMRFRVKALGHTTLIPQGKGDFKLHV